MYVVVVGFDTPFFNQCKLGAFSELVFGDGSGLIDLANLLRMDILSFTTIEPHYYINVYISAFPAAPTLGTATIMADFTVLVMVMFDKKCSYPALLILMLMPLLVNVILSSAPDISSVLGSAPAKGWCVLETSSFTVKMQNKGSEFLYAMTNEPAFKQLWWKRGNRKLDFLCG